MKIDNNLELREYIDALIESYNLNLSISDMFLEAINVAEVFRCLAKPWMREQLLKTVEEAYVFFQEKMANEEAYQALLDSNQKLFEENLRLRSL